MPGTEEVFEEGEAPTNIDYLKLAKAGLETLRLDDVVSPASFKLLQESTLAVQIAQVEATDELARTQRVLLHNMVDAARDPGVYYNDDPGYVFPEVAGMRGAGKSAVLPEEDNGEDCIHGVNVGGECASCDGLLASEPAIQNIADQVENEEDDKPGLLRRIADGLGDPK